MSTQGTATIDFGNTPAVDEYSFSVVDGTLAGMTYAEAWFMRDTHADSDETAHEMAATFIQTACSIAGTTLTIVCNVLGWYPIGNFKIRWVAN